MPFTFNIGWNFARRGGTNIYKKKTTINHRGHLPTDFGDKNVPTERLQINSQMSHLYSQTQQASSTASTERIVILHEKIILKT